MQILTRLILFMILLFATNPLYSQAPRAVNGKPLRIGIIGLDTSHVTAFTQLLNDPTRPDHVPGARIVAAFKGGSPDIESSARRIEQFTAEMRDKWGVELIDSIEELCQKVDAVIIASVDGRTHLKQVRPVFAAKKRVFIDKPLAANFREAREIARLARESGTPFFSTSSLRYTPEFQALKKNADLGDILGVFSYGPAPLEPHHTDLFWYGIHSVEMLYTLMGGPGCEEVSRTFTNGADVVVGRWKNNRSGIVRGIRDGAKPYGAVVFGSKTVLTSEPKKIGYRDLLVEMVRFFETGVPPVSPEETLEIMAFMEAADISKSRGGAPVALKELFSK